MDVLDIVKQWLKSHGYDGLYNDECGCTLKEFAPCGEICGDCRAGYIHIGYGEWDYFIMPEKPSPTPPTGEKETK